MHSLTLKILLDSYVIHKSFYVPKIENNKITYWKCFILKKIINDIKKKKEKKSYIHPI